MTGADFTYKFGPKNNWRRWVWNRIVERLGVPAKDAIVLYLAGEQDFDRSVALRHGFNENNLIAVERDETVAKRLRAEGKLVVEGDLFDVITYWPPDRRLDVILADLCCGLEAKILGHLIWLRWHPAQCTAVYALNFLRGRDPSANEIRAFQTMLFDQMIEDGLAQRVNFTHQRKHRGSIFWSFYFYSFIHWCWDWPEGNMESWPPEEQARFCIKANSLRGHFQKALMPRISSYRSTSLQTFDSIVFKSPAHFLPAQRFHEEEEYVRARLAGHPLRRSIGAVLAHRTMRKEKIGIYANKDA